MSVKRRFSSYITGQRESAFTQALPVIVSLMASLLLVAASTLSADEPVRFERRGVISQIRSQSELILKAERPVFLKHRSPDAVEAYFVRSDREWIIVSEDGSETARCRITRLNESGGVLNMNAMLVEPTSEIRAGFAFGEYLPVKRIDPPARILSRKKERPTLIRHAVDKKEMLYIPEDYLVFGQGTDEAGDDFNPHFYEREVSVTPHIRAFYMDRTEVTNQEYYRFCKKTGHAMPPEWKEGFPADQADHPFVYATFADVQAYARWTGKRLPTEWEWELAARGGLREREGIDEFSESPPSYPAGADPTGCITLDQGRSMAVNELQDKNRRGLVGMCGNAPEWTSSYYAPYPGARFQRYMGRIRRVLRGGAFYLPADRARAEARMPASELDKAGFRLVLDVK